MIDALLWAVVDAVRGADLGYGDQQCDVKEPPGKPPPGSGDVYVAVWQGASVSDMMNALNEYFDFTLTLTMRLTGVPPDRVGDQLLARKLARSRGPQGQPSFNSRTRRLATFLHMNWAVIGDANSKMVEWSPDVEVVYGFSVPAQFAGSVQPELVGPEWLGGEADPEAVALKSDVRFQRCRRGPQAIGSYS